MVVFFLDGKMAEGGAGGGWQELVWTEVWILVPRPGIKHVPPAVEVHSLNHWMVREVPRGFKIIVLANIC